MIENVTMPFGKFKGECLLDIPVDYLEWVYENVETSQYLNDAISYAIDLLKAEKERRGVTK